PSETEAKIAGLLDQSTQELRLAWHKWHRTEPPFGISRDLIIRGLAYELQQRAHGGPNRPLRRRLQSLAGASERGARSAPPADQLVRGEFRLSDGPGCPACTADGKGDRPGNRQSRRPLRRSRYRGGREWRAVLCGSLSRRSRWEFGGAPA